MVYEQWDNESLQHTYLYELFKDFTAPIVALVGIAVTGTMAGLGLRSFAKFKREKIEERRIEVALDALAIAYESKFVFETIRARAIARHEYENATDPRFMVGDVGIRVNIRDGQQGAYAVLRRIEGQEEFFERVRKIEPRFMAVFGTESESIFVALYSARTQLAAAAETLFEIGHIESEDAQQISGERRELRHLIFRGLTEEKENDKMGVLTDGFRTRIEALCRPIVDHQYGKVNKP